MSPAISSRCCGRSRRPCPRRCAPDRRAAAGSRRRPSCIVVGSRDPDVGGTSRVSSAIHGASSSRLAFRRSRAVSEYEVLRAVAVRDDRRAGVLEGLQPVDVVGVVVGDDHVAHRLWRDARISSSSSSRASSGEPSASTTTHAVARDHEGGVRDEVAVGRRAQRRHALHQLDVRDDALRHRAVAPRGGDARGDAGQHRRRAPTGSGAADRQGASGSAWNADGVMQRAFGVHGAVRPCVKAVPRCRRRPP